MENGSSRLTSDLGEMSPNNTWNSNYTVTQSRLATIQSVIGMFHCLLIVFEISLFTTASSLPCFHACFSNTAVKRLRMREFLSELSFELVQRLRKSIRLSAFIKENFLLTQGRYSGVFLYFVFLFSPHSFVYNLPLFFPRFLRYRTCALRLTAVFALVASMQLI